ncbi:hypothetical protein GQ600_24925 [Phytophthora cactorum]|nr:hypothetical protein GQ600_24925 [Phytophthora cactorum]
MGWKAVESEEYESSAPAVQAHFHAVRAEEALRRDDVRFALHLLFNLHNVAIQITSYSSHYRHSSLQYVQAEKEGHLASEKFLQAAQRVSDKRTIDALILLAENYEYRAKVARARNPRPVETEEKDKVTGSDERHSEDERERNVEQRQEVEAETRDPEEAQKTETQLNVAAAEMEELWRRLMEQQLGGRAPLDPRRSGGTSTNGNGSTPYRYQDERTSSGNDDGSASGQGDCEGLQETMAHQKMEIVRLLNAVKTLSSENTKLVKKCEALTNVQAENREIRESMDLFKKDYNQKVCSQKLVRQCHSVSEARRAFAPARVADCCVLSGNSALENKIKRQEEQIAKLMDEARIKDDRIAKYDKWYKTLKAGAKAKQLSQSRDGRNGSFSSSSFVQNGGGSLSGPSNSFTSSSFHDYSPGSDESTGSSSSSSRQFSRPPAHPNRRAL